MDKEKEAGKDEVWTRSKKFRDMDAVALDDEDERLRQIMIGVFTAVLAICMYFFYIHK